MVVPIVFEQHWLEEYPEAFLIALGWTLVNGVLAWVLVEATARRLRRNLAG